MALPGFTAAASIYPSRISYRGNATPATADAVVRAAFYDYEADPACTPECEAKHGTGSVCLRSLYGGDSICTPAKPLA